MTDPQAVRNVMVTGATGFVGRHVVRALLTRGFKPICLVRDAAKLQAQYRDVGPDRLVPIVGDLHDEEALRHAADLSQAAIHLVGIIIARHLKRQSFDRIHVRGTAKVLDAVERAGISRYLHMSALGTGPDAATPYQQTKWTAEQDVAARTLDWTIFRPSLIHGPDGEFMRLVHAFVCGLNPPFIPYFGNGQARIQPVYVRDVAQAFVEALSRDKTIDQVIPLGGPRAYTWLEMYEVCRRVMPGARRWKPYISLPPPVAKCMAAASAPALSVAELVAPSIGKFRFDAGQVAMATEDSVCDHTIAQRAFDMKMRDFETELAAYAADIR